MRTDRETLKMMELEARECIENHDDVKRIIKSAARSRRKKYKAAKKSGILNHIKEREYEH